MSPSVCKWAREEEKHIEWMVIAGDCLHRRTNPYSLRHEVESISVHPFKNEGQSEGETQTREDRVGERLDTKLLRISDVVGRSVG